MDLKEIMSVSGQSGLFKFVSQGRNGIIVESFADNKRIFISASRRLVHWAILQFSPTVKKFL